MDSSFTNLEIILIEFTRLYKLLEYTVVRIQDTGYRIQDTGYRIQDTGYRIQDTGYRIQDSLCRVIKRRKEFN